MVRSTLQGWRGTNGRTTMNLSNGQKWRSVRRTFKILAVSCYINSLFGTGLKRNHCCEWRRTEALWLSKKSASCCSLIFGKVWPEKKIFKIAVINFPIHFVRGFNHCTGRIFSSFFDIIKDLLGFILISFVQWERLFALLPLILELRLKPHRSLSGQISRINEGETNCFVQVNYNLSL